MKCTLLHFVFLLWISSFSVWAQQPSPTLKIGNKIKSFSTTDQHGKAVQVKPGPKHALISFDMGVAKLANKQLHARGAKYLPSANAIYIANIHGMPKIGRVFAMPKMRRYAHQIVLADAEGLLDGFPQKKGTVTVLKLNSKGTILDIKYWDPAKQKIEDLLK